MDEKNLIASNAKIKFDGVDVESVTNYEFDLEVEGIENTSPETVKNVLDIKVAVVENGTYSISKKCACCGRTKDEEGEPLLTYRHKVKILSITTDESYTKINFNTKEEKEIFSQIIKKIRMYYFHGQYSCVESPRCKNNSLKEESELYRATQED